MPPCDADSEQCTDQSPVPYTGNPVTDPKYDQQGGLDFWHTHGLITARTRRDVMEHCNMTMEPLGHFCGGPGATWATAGVSCSEPVIIAMKPCRLAYDLQRCVHAGCSLA
jgi:hypothetical protein